ncbi:MAG TPA: hypothetical protein VNK95_00590 [Caldilineaceae bacterium]|nr:hypothetical protein [Caldilineaceae bacterium]
MIRLGKKTKQSAAQVLDKAVDYFGPAGVGLELIHRDEASVEFQDSLGHVAVRAQPDEGSGMTDVEIVSREWDWDAEQFLEKI